MVSAETNGNTASQAPNAVSSTTAQGRSLLSDCRACRPCSREVHQPWAMPRSSAQASAGGSAAGRGSCGGVTAAGWTAIRCRRMIQATAAASASMAASPSSVSVIGSSPPRPSSFSASSANSRISVASVAALRTNTSKCRRMPYQAIAAPISASPGSSAMTWPMCVRNCSSDRLPVSSTVQNTAMRCASRSLPVQRREAGCSARLSSALAASASSSGSSSGGAWAPDQRSSCDQAHRLRAVLAIRLQGIHSTRLRRPRHSGSASPVHRANSCQGFAPVW